MAGLVGMACVAFLMAMITRPLGAPWWAVILIVVVWLIALGLALAWFTSRPRTVVVLPIAVALVWLVIMLSGVRFLGWLDV